jgi:tetratricopeptide (TPR) repeat protein
MTQRIDQLDREASIHRRRADDYKRDADFFKECGSSQDYRAALDAAIRELQLAISFLSQRDQTMYQLAEYLLQKGKREDAVMWFKRVYESNGGVTELGRAARARLQQLGEW